MKSKICWFNGRLFKNTLKRYWWFGFLVFLTSFFSVSVSSAVLAANAAAQQAANPLVHTLDDLLAGYFMGKQFIVTDPVLALIFGAAAGLVFFGYLHNKRQADFFHGQPVSRETHIFTRFAAGCALYAAAYFLNLLFAYVILLSYGAKAAVIGFVLLRLLLVLLVFACMYALSILCAMLTGNPFAHLQAGFVLSFGGTLLMYCLYWMAETFLQTYSPISLDGLSYGSLPVYLVWRLSSGEFNLLNAFCVVVILAGLLALCVIAYRKRPVEFTGGMFAFPKLQPIFRAALCLLTGTLLGSVFYSVLESVPFCIFGLILGAFLGHILCQGQFNRSFGGMFTAFIPFAATAAALVAVTACFIMDVTSFERYIPAQTDVRCVGITIEGDEPYLRRTFDENGNVISHSPLETVVFDDPEVVGAVLDMAQSGISAVEGRKKAEYGTSSKTYTIRYTLADGKQVQRIYEAIPDATVAKGITTLLCADAYTAQNDLLRLDVSRCGNMSLMTSGGNDSRSAKDSTEKAQLLEALQQDLVENGRPVDTLPLGSVACEFFGTMDEEDTESRDIYRYMEFSVYASYSHTLAVAESWGVKLEAMPEETLANAAYVCVRDGNQYDNILFETDDPEKIRAILQSGQVFGVYGGMTLTEPVTVEVLLKDDEHGMSLEQMEKEGYGYRFSEKMAMDAFRSTSFVGYVNNQYSVLLGGLDKLGVVIPG
ncbi:MAG: hypothetical protein PHC80_03255 [Eubacteriales bacterium]|nr:hypothetical protein [Eubacteriales bacterium]